MIDGLKPYSSMKDTGLPWLGQIPESWQILRAKSVFRVIDVRSESGTEELLTVSSNDGVVPRSQKNVTMFKAESYVGHKLCWPGDLVINSLWAWMQGLGFSRHYGLVSTAYSVYRPKAAFAGYAQYFHYSLRSAAYKRELLVRSKGVWLSRLQLSDPSFLDMPIILPPEEDQAAIVRFLDYVGRRIRTYIRAKQKLIKLLEEQKQAIIHRAVTRGLDLNAPVKPSGLTWWPFMPEGFERQRLGRVCLSIRDGTHNPPPAVPGIHRLLSVRNIVAGRFQLRDDDRTMTGQAFEELQRSYTLHTGDIVLALVGATTGKCAVVGDVQDVTVQRSLGILRPNPRIVSSSFLNVVIRSEFVQAQIRQTMDKYAAQPGIYLEDVGRLQVMFPNLRMQHRIVENVARETAPIDKIADHAVGEIEALKELRTRLVADIVTGKLDTCGKSAKLPKEVEEATGIPEPDESIEEDEENMEVDSEEAAEEAQT